VQSPLVKELEAVMHDDAHVRRSMHSRGAKMNLQLVVMLVDRVSAAC
jgi:hypothetical protein